MLHIPAHNNNNGLKRGRLTKEDHDILPVLAGVHREHKDGADASQA